MEIEAPEGLINLSKVLEQKVAEPRYQVLPLSPSLGLHIQKFNILSARYTLVLKPTNDLTVQ